MFLPSHRKALRITILSTIAVLFYGCDKVQPSVYDIPKEERSVKAPFQTEQTTSSASDPSSMQVLPGMEEAANSAPEISYNVPEGWKELKPSGIRKVNFTINSDSGSAEVTVLTFPGDVGGTLANINRWRGQIELEPATVEDIRKFSEPYEIAGHQGLYIRLEGDAQSILGAALPFHGNSWFFKMLGDTSIVLANEEAMKQFLDSVQFEAHAH